MPEQRAVKIGDWILDSSLNRITRGNDSVLLEPLAAKVLEYLAQHANQVVGIDVLTEHLWQRRLVGDSPVYRIIADLRHALQDDARNPRYVETIRKRGYRLVAAVDWQDEPSGLRTSATESDQRSSVQHATKRKRVGMVALTLLGVAVFSGVFLGFRGELGQRDGRLAENNLGKPTLLRNEAFQPMPRSIAVLAFDNMSEDQSNAHFADGISEVLIHQLSNVPDLRVIARTSSFSFRGTNADIREIGQALNVALVLQGSVQKAHGTLRVVAQLLDTRTGTHYWSKIFNRKDTDIFAIQDEIAGSVVAALKVALGDDPKPVKTKIKSIGTNSTAAYERYLNGLRQQSAGSNKQTLLATISFKEALALDPDFYDAKLELAYAYWRQQGNGEITSTQATEHIRPLLGGLLESRPGDGRALALVPIAQGYYYRDRQKTLGDLMAAIQKAPNSARLYGAIAGHLRTANRPLEAFEWLDRGLEIDPLNGLLFMQRGIIQLDAGDLDEAETSFARWIELSPGNASAYQWASNVPLIRKQYATAFAMARKAIEVDPLDYELPALHAIDLYLFGFMDEGDTYLQRGIAIAPDKATVRYAKLYRQLMLGDFSAARDTSEHMLRDDVDNRSGAYEFAAMVFVSTMSSLEKTNEALAVLEELQPGVSSPDFHPGNIKEFALQYNVVLTLAHTQTQAETRRMLDSIVPRWDESVPAWQDSFRAAPIALARGQTNSAVVLVLEHLAQGIGPAMRYRHISFYKALALQPAVAERLVEIENEMNKDREGIATYLAEYALQ